MMPEIQNVDFSRDEIFNLLNHSNNIGVELGIALGDYSKKAIDSGKFKLFIGIDSYDMGKYNITHYKEALKKNNITNNSYKILKMKFEDALDLFEDQSIDFIYFDGFAHNGQLGGKTIIDWYKKIKINGIVAGDDYDDKWPLVKKVVNEIANQLNVILHITKIKKSNEYSEFASWYFYKKNNHSLKLDMKIYRESIIRDKLEILVLIKDKIKLFIIISLKLFLPKKVISFLKKRNK